MAKLIVENISKTYKKRRVVSDANFVVDSGNVVGLLGPNGAGKTTSFYMTVGLVRADTGRIMLDDRNITHLSMYQRANLGLSYLPQEASVFRKLTVHDNIASVLEMKKITKSEQQQIVEDLLAELHISHIKNELGLSLSGGERRRVEIARCLATQPKCILLDEPFAGVDPISIQDIKNIILHLKSRNIGVLITDHNVRETLTICDHAYIMSEGSVIAEGNPEVILENQQVRDVYLGNEFSI